jgi:uncharacterized oligopeptide transporter (OPT) family protein
MRQKAGASAPCEVPVFEGDDAAVAMGSDGAMAQRAECVMLNKGPHVDTAIIVLDDILRRMSGHQGKKTALLPPLRSWVDAS